METSDGLNANQKQVIEAYVWIRKNNMSIPDYILDTMKNAAVVALKTEIKDILQDKGMMELLRVSDVLLVQKEKLVSIRTEFNRHESQLFKEYPFSEVVAIISRIYDAEKKVGDAITNIEVILIAAKIHETNKFIADTKAEAEGKR